MMPLERLRLEKAAADCGFEMTPTFREGRLELRSARFPESVFVRVLSASEFEVTASTSALLDAPAKSSAVVVHDYPSLYGVLAAASAHARTLPNRVADAFRRQTANLPRTTEVEQMVIRRVGQDLFRAALMDYWQSRCCVTGLHVPELLRASHIKPWAACDTDDERLDVFNGLLLAPHVDCLFDGGWISFCDNGRLLVSAALPRVALSQLGVSPTWSIPHLKPAHARYLTFHRCNVLRGTPGELVPDPLPLSASQH